MNLRQNLGSCSRLCAATQALLFAAVGASGLAVSAQTRPSDDVAAKVQQLTESIARAQAQIDDSQRQMDEMRRQLTALQQQFTSTAAPGPRPAVAPVPAAATPASIDAVQEQQEMQASQLATIEQEKVGSESRYPVKISGLLLFNGFVNSGKVDVPATPTASLFGAGTAGASVRQTVLGIDARGPHLFGATSSADLRVDFDGDPASSLGSATSAYPASYSANATLLRLRTAHATLQWPHTQAFFALDRPILSPDTPTSLTAVAEPALAWSGNLWAWSPQAGITQDIPLRASNTATFQVALIDAADAPETLAYKTNSATSLQPSAAEQSQWPGTEARISLLHGQPDRGPRLGVGGYLSPHHSTTGQSFNAWAGTLDLRTPLPARMQFTGSFYRGQALGGLGAGAYKDYIVGTTAAGNNYFESVDDVGGWAQLKQQPTQRLQFNQAIGLDEIFAKQLRPYAGGGSSSYLNFARNRTYTGNVIYSPSAYLLFSFEFRRLETAPVSGHLWVANIYGIAAGYKF